MMDRSEPGRRRLRFRIRLWTGLFIGALALSGITAIPLNSEVAWLVKITGANTALPGSSYLAWLQRVQASLQNVSASYPFLFYGTDWLAFGHLALALGFVGAWRDPVRNRWLYDFGLLTCLLVVPYALCFGLYRGIPLWWRGIDCWFGIFGFLVLWPCRRWTLRLERAAVNAVTETPASQSRQFLSSPPA